MPALLLALLAAGNTHGGERAERPSRLESRAAAALVVFRATVPQRYFDDAHGYAVLPAVTRVGIGIGGAWGRGLLYEDGAPAAVVRYWQASSGIQAGARRVSLIIFFRDAAALDDIRAHGVRFAGQAGFAAGQLGALKTPAYSSGVAIFAAERFGFMTEATIAAMGLSFRPPP